MFSFFNLTVKRPGKIFSVAVLIVFLALTLSCSKDQADSSLYSIAVFVPGMLEGSPTYEQMDSGVRRAAEKEGAKVTTIEGGFNQGEWKDKVMALAADGSYSLIVTSNPALSEICQSVKDQFPAQTFLVLDGTPQDDGELIVFTYNHREQGFLAGYLGAKLALSDLKNLSGQKKLGLIAGQTYPDMEKSIVPGFIMGMKSVDPDFEMEFGVVGNWYDAAKASDLADSMIRNGVDVILPIAGGAGQGVVSAAKKAGKYLLWFDSAGTDQAQGTILGSAIVRQEKAAEETVSAIMAGDLDEGDQLYGNVSNGYILIDTTEEGYMKNVPPSIRNDIDFLSNQFIQGRYSLDDEG